MHNVNYTTVQKFEDIKLVHIAPVDPSTVCSRDLVLTKASKKTVGSI